MNWVLEQNRVRLDLGGVGYPEYGDFVLAVLGIWVLEQNGVCLDFGGVGYQGQGNLDHKMQVQQLVALGAMPGWS